MVMKRILVKCADISNPCRPTELCKAWAQRIAEEYFSQVSSSIYTTLSYFTVTVLLCVRVVVEGDITYMVVYYIVGKIILLLL